MYTLIFIFGVWINPNYIVKMETIAPHQKYVRCRVDFVGDTYKNESFDGKTCKEIKKAIDAAIEKTDNR